MRRICLPPLNISIDGKEIIFDEEKQEKIEKLFNEGYFVVERKFGDVVKEVEKRGGNVSRNSQLYKKLNSLVRKEKLFKIKMVDGYRFKQR